MSSDIQFGSLLWLSLKLTYNEITTIMVVSVGFWIAALTVVPLGGAFIGLIQTIRTIPGEKRTEYESGVYFYSTTISNIRRGLPVSVMILITGGVTGLYLVGFLSTRSIEFFIGTLLGIYLLLYAIFLSYRISSLLTHEDAQTIRDTWGKISTGHFSLDILYLFLLLLFISVSVVLPVLLILLLPGFLAVFETIIYEAKAGTNNSQFRNHLDTIL